MKSPQIILVSIALLVGVGLYMMPISPIAQNQDELAQMPANTEVHSLLDDQTEVKNELDSAALANLNRWETSSDPKTSDSIVAFFDLIRKPLGASFYALKRAEKTDSVVHWTEAGERFLLNAKYMGSQAQKSSWFAQSKACFEKAIELDPQDLDIQVDLGVCLIEGASLLGTPPMEGIGILKKVEQQDPNNIKALINLGYFAIKSGQFDKAEERFLQVLKIDSKYADAHLYLADLHEQQKKFSEAVKDLENYKKLTADPERIKEVDAYILELSKNI